VIERILAVEETQLYDGGDSRGSNGFVPRPRAGARPSATQADPADATTASHDAIFGLQALDTTWPACHLVHSAPGLSLPHRPP
jgi:hypothetical protein